MNKTILFISERSIKDNSIIEENLDSKLIKITLKELQDIELYPILGEKLYEQIETEIKNKIVDPEYVIDADIAVLLNKYIKDFLIYGVLLNIPTALNYKFTNKGTKVLTDGNATNIIGGEIESIKKYYRAKNDSYRLRLTEYVNKNHNTGNACKPTSSSYSGGWSIPAGINVAKAVNRRANKLGRY